MKHGAKRNKRRFTRTQGTAVAAFCLSALLFGCVLLLPLIPADEPTDREVAGEWKYGQAMWLIFHDGAHLTGLVRLHSDPHTQTMTAVGYPPETEIIDGVSVTSAEKLYPVYGEQVAAMVEELPAVSVSSDGAATLISRLSGNLPFTLPQTVGTLPAGDLTLTPLQAVTVLNFDGWEQGGVGSAWAHAALVAAFLNRSLTKSRNLEYAFSVFAEACDTRLHIAQFEGVRGDLTDFCEANDGTICTPRVAAGYMTGTKGNRRYVCE